MMYIICICVRAKLQFPAGFGAKAGNHQERKFQNQSLLVDGHCKSSEGRPQLTSSMGWLENCQESMGSFASKSISNCLKPS